LRNRLNSQADSSQLFADGFPSVGNQVGQHLLDLVSIGVNGLDRELAGLPETGL
jgi:hypothetical protein